MIYIGICDDSEFWREEIRRFCCSVLNSLGQIYSIVEFSSGEEVLAYSGKDILLLFLDIEMSGMSGLEVMRKLEDNDRIWRIVFVSSHEELRWDTLDIKTLAYVNKPIEEIPIQQCIKAAIRENEKNKTILVNTLAGDHYLRVDDIKYIRAIGNYTEIHLKSEVLNDYHSIKYFEEQVQGSTLLRIHKSYLANLLYVDDITYGELKLIDGIVLPVGRVYYKSYREAYFTFLKSMTVERLG